MRRAGRSARILRVRGLIGGLGLGLVVVATVVGFFAVFAVWAKRQLLETDTWTETSSQLLEDHDIQVAVAGFLVDALYTNVDVQARLQEGLPPQLQGLAAPVSAGLRELSLRLANEALERPRVQALWKEANERAHETLIDVVRRDYSHPCIVAWVPFNESWGVPNLPDVLAQRHFVQGLYSLTKTLDPSRPVIGNDGWESSATDIIGIHDYDDNIERLASRKARAPKDGTIQQLDANTRAAIEELEHELATRVVLRPPRGKKAGQLVVEYYDNSHLMGLYDRILGRKH